MSLRLRCLTLSVTFTLMSLAVSLSVVALMGCEERCEVGGSCDRICEPGLAPVCVASSICECVNYTQGGGEVGGFSGGGGDTVGGSIEPPPVCDPLLIGDLVINEVMINPSTTEPNNEYVELVNVSDREIDLTGVNLTYGGDEKIRFTQGCMAPKSSVAAYSSATTDEVPWQWSTPPRAVNMYKYRFQFSNSRDFEFALFGGDGALLSSFSGPKSMIDDGKSITRSPELTGEPLEHDLASIISAELSPASCSNLGRFESGCADGATGGAEISGAEAGSITSGVEVGGTQASGGVGGGTPPPNCSPPLVNDLVINEVLINPEGDEGVGEFIEILNISDQAVNLDGIGLWYQSSSGELTLEIEFAAGCMAPMSAVVIRNNSRDEPWVWSTPTSDSGALGSGHSTFALANSRDAILELRARSGQRISQMIVFKAEISEGVSANRSPDAQESDVITSHLELNPSASTSPGYCPNGTRYEERCGGTP